jgi:hypothetical protein
MGFVSDNASKVQIAISFQGVVTLDYFVHLQRCLLSTGDTAQGIPRRRKVTK